MASPTNLVLLADHRKRLGVPERDPPAYGTIIVDGHPMAFWLPPGAAFMRGRNGEPGRVVGRQVHASSS